MVEHADEMGGQYALGPRRFRELGLVGALAAAVRRPRPRTKGVEGRKEGEGAIDLRIRRTGEPSTLRQHRTPKSLHTHNHIRSHDTAHTTHTNRQT